MVSEQHWHRDWVTTGQPRVVDQLEVYRLPGGTYSIVAFQTQLDVTPASQIISQEFA